MTQTIIYYSSKVTKQRGWQEVVEPQIERTQFYMDLNQESNKTYFYMNIFYANKFLKVESDTEAGGIQQPTSFYS